MVAELTCTQSRIAAETGCSAEDAPRVERIMVDDAIVTYLRPDMTADQIHPESFRDYARRAARYLSILKHLSQNPQKSAELLGWTRREFDVHVERYLS